MLPGSDIIAEVTIYCDRESFCPGGPSLGAVSRGTYSGEDIIKALQNWRFRKVDQAGSHVKLRYKDPNSGEVRTVIVPLHDELDTGTLKGVAEQASAKDFQSFLDEMDETI